MKDLWNSVEPDEKKYLRVGLLFILIFGAVAIFVLPFLFTIPASLELIDFSNKGPVGDTINGIAGPFIALIAAVLTFLAFYIQYKANKEQRDQFNTSLNIQKDESSQRENLWRVERFENRFYELLRLHRGNVEEMDVGNRVLKRKCFVPMFYELRYCYITLLDVYQATSEEERRHNKYERSNILNIAYSIFFFGIGFNSRKHYYENFSEGEKNLFDKVLPILVETQDEVWYELNDLGKPSYRKNYYLSGEGNDRSIDFFYFPFDGHTNQLGHYFRHLFQMCQYVLEQSFLNIDEQYLYIKSIRAQLSNFEQLILYYNSLTWYQLEWRELFTEFRLIKNLPLGLADFDNIPEKYFKDDIERLRLEGKTMFEALE